MADFKPLRIGDSGLPTEMGGTDTVPTPQLGSGTANGTTFLRGDQAWAAAPSFVAPNWHGVVYGAYGDCNPQNLMLVSTCSGSVAATPTNISTSLARVSFFVPPADITVNKIRFYGVGTIADRYKVAIYNANTRARLTAQLDVNPTAATWGAAGAALGLTLTAGQTYLIAVSAIAASTTAGLLCMSPTVAATTGQVAVSPLLWPGSLVLGQPTSRMNGGFGQFTVTTGALPDPYATVAAQGAWTGGMPAFWLDSNNT